MENAKLNTILVRDPRVIVDNQREFAVLESGIRFRAKPWTTTSISSANIPFSTPAPSGDIYVDRKISLTLPVRWTASGTVQPGFRLLSPNNDAPRAYPIHSMLDTISLTVNNATMTQNIGEIIHALLRFNNTQHESVLDYSSTPTALDQTQIYDSLVGSVANPLSMAGDANQRSQIGRGGFSGYTIVSNPVNELPIAQTMTAVVDLLLTEQIMMSPCFFGNGDASAFYNVTTMDWQFNFLNQAGNRLWSHVDDPAVSQITSTSVQFGNLTGFSYALAQPYLNINYITPNPRLKVGPMYPTVYPYFKVAKYATDLGVSLAYNNPNIPKSSTVQSNNIQLSSIPRRCYIYARPSNSVYYANPKVTDTYYGINQVSIQFENYSGLLAESTKLQLWQISRKNHCNIDWNNWSGQTFYPVGGSNYGTQYGGIGSILCIEFGTDIQLDPDMAPGTIGQFNLQVSAIIENIDPSGEHDSQAISLYIVTVSDGVFNIPALGVANTEDAVLSQRMVLDTLNSSMFYNYHDIQEVNGGDFLSSLKKATAKIIPVAKNVNKFLKDNKVISRGAKALSYVPLPIPGYQTGAKVIGDVADVFGYGEDEQYGGRKIAKKNLKQRARRN